jgi:hypothetical protein
MRTPSPPNNDNTKERERNNANDTSHPATPGLYAPLPISTPTNLGHCLPWSYYYPCVCQFLSTPRPEESQCTQTRCPQSTKLGILAIMLPRLQSSSIFPRSSATHSNHHHQHSSTSFGSHASFSEETHSCTLVIAILFYLSTPLLQISLIHIP